MKQTLAGGSLHCMEQTLAGASPIAWGGRSREARSGMVAGGAWVIGGSDLLFVIHAPERRRMDGLTGVPAGLKPCLPF